MWTSQVFAILTVALGIQGAAVNQPLPDEDGQIAGGKLDESHYFRIYGDEGDINSANPLPGGNRPGAATNSHSCGYIRSVPAHLRQAQHMYPRGLGYFYQKYTEAYGIPVLSSNQVSNSALQRACYVLRFMLADRYDVRNAFYKACGRVALIGVNEGTTSIPEHSHLPPWWNERARGLGATWGAPVSSGGEENALCLANDRYFAEDIVLHEYMHAVHNIGAKRAIRNFQSRLEALYNHARATGLWRGTYSMSTVQEYWAEGCQSYFNVNRHSDVPDGVAGPISNRPALRNHDPGLYNIIHEIYPCDNTYIKRCQKNRAAELSQSLRLNCRGGGGGPVTSNPPGATGQPPAPRTTDGGGQPPGSRTTNAGRVTGRPGACRDNNANCASWARSGECRNNPGYMLPNCRLSCNQCTGGGTCRDTNQNCASWARSGECQRNPGYMIPNCRLSCGRCMGGRSCSDNNPLCASWARSGECERNAGYMIPNCRRSCNRCT